MSAEPVNPLADTDIEKLRQEMLAFARLQLNDAHLAEDAVQEALAGALKNSSSFSRKATLKTWVFSILRYKIADVLRGRYREPVQQECKDCSTDDDSYFDSAGHWQTGSAPRAWGNTDQLVTDEHFWRVFDACLEVLPGDQARVFMMREFVELDTHEICDALEIKPANLHVLLHRARLRLRACLSSSWFNAEAQ